MREGAAIIVTGAVHEVDLASVASQLVRADRESDRWSEIEPRGDPIAGRRVRVEVTEQVLRRVVTSRWYDPITKEVREEYQSEVVRETTTRHTATTRADGTFRLRLAAPARDRAWNIRAVVQDAAGRETFTRASVEVAPTGREATGYGLQLRGTTHQFAVGAAVRAEVSTWGSPATRLAPAGGANRFLFLVTSPGRFEALVRGSPTVSTRFRTADEPNLEDHRDLVHREGLRAAGRGRRLARHRDPPDQRLADDRSGALRARPACHDHDPHDESGRPAGARHRAPARDRREARRDGCRGPRRSA